MVLTAFLAFLLPRAIYAAEEEGNVDEVVTSEYSEYGEVNNFNLSCYDIYGNLYNLTGYYVLSYAYNENGWSTFYADDCYLVPNTLKVNGNTVAHHGAGTTYYGIDGTQIYTYVHVTEHQGLRVNASVDEYGVIEMWMYIVGQGELN